MNGDFSPFFRSLVLVWWRVLCESVLALLHFSFLLCFEFFVCLLVWGFFGVHLGFFPLFASCGWVGCGVSFVWLFLGTVVNVSIFY